MPLSGSEGVVLWANGEYKIIPIDDFCKDFLKYNNVSMYEDAILLTTYFGTPKYPLTKARYVEVAPGENLVLRLNFIGGKLSTIEADIDTIEGDIV